MNTVKRAFAVLLTLLLTLSALAEEDINALRRENEILKNRLAAYEDPGVVAVFDVGQVRFDEVYEAFQQQMEIYSELSKVLGVDLTLSPEEQISLQMEITRDLAMNRLIDSYLAAQGAELISKQEEEALYQKAQQEYALIYQENLSYYEETGLAEDEAQLMAERYMLENGLGVEDLFESELESRRRAALTELFVGDARPDEAQLQAFYDELLSSDQAYYSESPADYPTDALYNDVPPLWVPEGCRRVRLLILGFDEDDMIAYDELLSREDPPAEELDQLFSHLTEQAEDIAQRLEAGESLAALAAERESPLLPSELLNPDGIVVNEAFDLIGDEAIQAAMALSQQGEISRPVRCPWGLLFIQYLGEVTPGPRPLDEVREAISNMALSSLREQRYAEKLDQLARDARLTFFFDRLG